MEQTKGTGGGRGNGSTTPRSMLPPDVGTGCGWPKDDVIRDLWAWFSSLSARDRVEMIAIEDPLWTRFFLFL